MAGHSTPVINNSWDIAKKNTQTGTRVTLHMNNLPYIQTSMSNLLSTDILQVMSLSYTHSPLASSSQISKNAIRSYLQ